MWHTNIHKSNFSNFLLLENYMKESNWEERRELESRIKTIILDHLQLLSENFGRIRSLVLKLTLTQYNQNLIQINFIEFITVKTRLCLRVALLRYALFRRLSTKLYSHVTIYSEHN